MRYGETALNVPPAVRVLRIVAQDKKKRTKNAKLDRENEMGVHAF